MQKKPPINIPTLQIHQENKTSLLEQSNKDHNSLKPLNNQGHHQHHLSIEESIRAKARISNPQTISSSESVTDRKLSRSRISSDHHHHSHKQLFVKVEEQQKRKQVFYPNSLVQEEQLDKYINMGQQSDRDLVVQILAKHPLKRNELEIRFLRLAFQNIKFFAETEKEIQEQFITLLYKKLHIENMIPGQRVFRYGDTGKNFYIILKGSVYVLLKKGGIIDRSNTLERSATKVINMDDEELERITAEKNNLKEILLNNEISEEEKIKAVEVCNPGFWVVRSLQTGDSFGEIALQAEGDRMRTATIVCREDTHFGVLTREDFNAILARVYERKKYDKICFLQQIDLFSSWTYSDLSSLLHHIETETHKRGSVLFEEGEVPKKLYIILEGEVEINKRIVIKESEDLLSKSLSSFSLPVFLEPRRSSRLKSPAVTRSMKQAILTRTEYFGETGCIDRKPSNYSAIISSSQATFMILNRDKFAKFIKDPKTLQTIEKHISQRNKWHNKQATFFKNLNNPEYEEPITEINRDPKVIIGPNYKPSTPRPMKLQFHSKAEHKIRIHTPHIENKYNSTNRSVRANSKAEKNTERRIKTEQSILKQPKDNHSYKIKLVKKVSDQPLAVLLQKSDEELREDYIKEKQDNMLKLTMIEENDPELIQSLNFVRDGYPAAKPRVIKIVEMGNSLIVKGTNKHIDTSEENLKNIYKSTTISNNLDSPTDFHPSQNVFSRKFTALKTEIMSQSTPIDEVLLRSLKTDEWLLSESSRGNNYDGITPRSPIFSKTGLINTNDILMSRTVKYGGHTQVLKKGVLRSLYGQLRTISRIGKKE